MDSLLCIIVGQEYLKPSVVVGIRDNLIELILKNSVHYPYLYLLYDWNNRLSSYVPCCRIYKGTRIDVSDTKVPVVFVRPSNA